MFSVRNGGPPNFPLSTPRSFNSLQCANPEDVASVIDYACRMATLLITQWLKGIKGRWHRLYLSYQRRFRARLSGLLNHPPKHKLAVISRRHVGRVGGEDPRCVLSINAVYAWEPNR